jgi:hypothetical protein
MAKKKRTVYCWHLPILATIGVVLFVGGGIAAIVFFPRVPEKEQPRLLILGISLLVFSLPCVWSLLYRVIWRPKLIVEEDRLQLIYFGSKIAGEIPFANLREVRIGHFNTDEGTFWSKILCFLNSGGSSNEEEKEGVFPPRIEIILASRKDKKTWWPRIMGKHRPYDIRIRNVFKEPSVVIVRALQARLQYYYKEYAENSRVNYRR